MRRLQSLFAGLIYFFVFCNATTGQSPAWERINPIPFETYVKDCRILDNGRVVAVGGAATIVVSDDFGETWDIQYMPGDLPFYISLNAVSFQENTGYAAGSYFSLLKTENGGATWTKLCQNSSSVDDKYNDIECAPSGAVYMVVNEKFFLKSVDGGLVWDTIFHSDSITFSEIHFIDELNGYTKALSEENEYILRTADAGNNWDLAKLDIPFESFETGPMYFISPDTGFIGGDTAYDSFIFKTTNGGESWYQVYNSSVTGISQFNFCNSDTGFSIGGVIWYSNNLLGTIDGGESWEILSEHFGAWFLRTFDLKNNGEGLFFGDNGQIIRTNNERQEWEYLSNMVLYKYSIDHCFVINDSTIIASVMGGGGGVPDCGVIQSDDRGITWSKWDFYNCILSLSYINDSTGYCCTENWEYNFYKTSDRGLSWQELELGPNEISPQKVVFTNENTGYVGGPSDGEYGFILYKTGDGGNTWTPIVHELFNAVETFKDLEFYNDSSAILVGDIYPFDDNSQILVTTNSGIDWRMDTFYVYPHDFEEVHFVNPDTGLLFGQRKICRTIDGGNNWYQIDFGYDNALNNDLAVSFANEFVGYLSIRTVFVEPVSMVLKTLDAGESWFEIDNPSTAQYNSMGFFTEDEGVIVGNAGTIFRTESGGMVGMPEWPLYEDNHLNIFPNPSYGEIAIDTPPGFSSGTVMLQTIDGKTVLMKKYSYQENIKLNLTGQAGIYLITLINGGKSISGKLVYLGR